MPPAPLRELFPFNTPRQRVESGWKTGLDQKHLKKYPLLNCKIQLQRTLAMASTENPLLKGATNEDGYKTRFGTAEALIQSLIGGAEQYSVCPAIFYRSGEWPEPLNVWIRSMLLGGVSFGAWFVQTEIAEALLPRDYAITANWMGAAAIILVFMLTYPWLVYTRSQRFTSDALVFGTKSLWAVVGLRYDKHSGSYGYLRALHTPLAEATQVLWPSSFQSSGGALGGWLYLASGKPSASLPTALQEQCCTAEKPCYDVA